MIELRKKWLPIKCPKCGKRNLKGKSLESIMHNFYGLHYIKLENYPMRGVTSWEMVCNNCLYLEEIIEPNWIMQNMDKEINDAFTIPFIGVTT